MRSWALEIFFRHGDMLSRPSYVRIRTVGPGHVLIADVLGPPQISNLWRLRDHRSWGVMARVGFPK